MNRCVIFFLKLDQLIWSFCIEIIIFNFIPGSHFIFQQNSIISDTCNLDRGSPKYLFVPNYFYSGQWFLP